MLWLHPYRVSLGFLFFISRLFTVILRGRKMHERLDFVLLRKKSKIEKILENAAILEM